MEYNIYTIGDHLVTNFYKEKEALYRAAIKESGNRYLYISANAYWDNGHKDESLMALRCTKSMDLSHFWEIFRRLEKTMQNKYI